MVKNTGNIYHVKMSGVYKVDMGGGYPSTNSCAINDRASFLPWSWVLLVLWTHFPPLFHFVYYTKRKPKNKKQGRTSWELRRLTCTLFLLCTVVLYGKIEIIGTHTHKVSTHENGHQFWLQQSHCVYKHPYKIDTLHKKTPVTVQT